MIKAYPKINAGYILAFAAVLLAEIVIALFAHDDFIRPYIGDVLVVILIYCFLRIVVPPYRILPADILLFSSAVELAQYFNLAKLPGLNNNRILAIILGSTFDPADLLCYLAGTLLLYIWQCKTLSYPPAKR